MRHAEILLDISFLGYATFHETVRFKEGQNIIDLGHLVLRQSQKLLAEVKVEAPVQAVTFKPDTIEYDVRAFNVSADDRLEQLLRQLPGLEFDENGNLKSEGEYVPVLRVNGTSFFGGQVTEYLNKLPADILAKVQVIDDYGQEANFTGIKTGKPRKILNLVTKPGMDKGTFGSASVEGNSNDIYGSKLSGNYWRGQKQASASGNLSSSSQALGTSTANTLQLSYNDLAGKKTELNGNYAFGNSRGNAANELYTETINSLGTMYNRASTRSGNRAQNHSLGLGVNYGSGKKSYFNVNSSLVHSLSATSSAVRSSQSGLILRDLETESTGRQVGNTITVSGSTAIRLGKNAISLNGSFSNNSNRSNQAVNDRIGYYNDSNLPAKDSVISRLIGTQGSTFGGVIRASYTKMFGKSLGLNGSYLVSLNSARSALQTGVQQPDEQISRVDSLSNRSTNLIVNHTLSLGLNFGGKKLRAFGGLSVQPSRINGNYFENGDRIKTSTLNFAPSTSINYTASPKMSFSLSYSGNRSAPSISFLQPVRDTRNLQNIVIGNPNLKPIFTHTLNGNYRHTHPASQRTFSVGLNASTTRNAIVSNTLFLKDTLKGLKQETRYQNMNGAFTLGSNYSMTVPYKLLKKIYRITLTGSIGLNNTIFLTQGQENRSRVLSFSQGVSSFFQVKNTTIDVGSNFRFGSNRYTLAIRPETDVTSLAFYLNVNQKIKKLGVMASAAKTINTGMVGLNSRAPLIVNVSMAQQLFKYRTGSLGISVTDVFNQGNQAGRIISGNSIIENQTMRVTRIVSANFTASVNRFGGKRRN